MTECTITSVYRQMLFSQGSIQFDYGLNQRFLISCNHPIKVICDGNERRVGCEQLILGERFEIKGIDERMVTIQGIAFIPQNISKGGEKLYILNKQDVPIVDGLINLNSDSSQANLSEAQQQLDLLWNKLDLIEMNDELKAISPAMAQGKIDKRLIIVHRYIRLNYGEPLTLQLLADLINCNPVYLSNTYTKLFKITPMKYLQVTRMKKASELLKETNMSIKDITTHLGYVNNSQFSTIFKRYFSCTPVEYRRNQHLQMRSIGIF